MTGQVNFELVKLSKIETCQIKLRQVNSGWDRSSQVGAGQVKSSFGRSSQVAIG